MNRRLAGWLMGFFPDEKPTPKVPFACAIGWHRLRIMRVRGDFYFGCARRGCDHLENRPTRELLNKRPGADS